MPYAIIRFSVLAVMAVAVLAPLSLVGYQSFLSAPFFDSMARFTLDAYRFVFSESDFWTAFGTTLMGMGLAQRGCTLQEFIASKQLDGGT